MRKQSPYRTLDCRCQECSASGERCVRPAGHDGMHVLPDGSAWVWAGDASFDSPGGDVSLTIGTKGSEVTE